MADPVSILDAEAEVNKGENARLASFVGAIAIADLVKTTLGPKGMDKMLQSMDRSGDLNITNDGATILKSIHIDNPAAKVLVDMSKTQDDEVGDGTTSVVVLAGELLREAEKLVQQRIHPMTIVDGWRLATKAAREALIKSARDNGDDKEKFREDLLNIAKTTLSSKLLNKDKEKFANLAVDAVLRLGGSTDLNLIQILKMPGGSLEQSFLDEGFLLKKKIGVGQPREIHNAKIMVANTPMDTDKIKIYGSRVKVDSMDKVAEIEEEEKRKMKAKVEKIKAFGINVFINRQLIYNYPEQLFADAGIMAIEHADFDGVERLACVTGAELVSTFDHPELCTLGTAKCIKEVMIGEERLISFSGVKEGNACTVVLRGASTHVLDEAERSLHDALAVLSQTVRETRVTLGGGCAEMLMAKAVDDIVPQTSGKKSLAVEAFGRALRALPTTIADNGGYDSTELVAELRAEHYKGNSTAGLDMYQGCIGDMNELGIKESFKLKEHVLMAAAEAAEMILRVDDIIKCAPRRRDGGM
uniref:T-complex protein 1 subunit beta n=1 Tax=Aplanochytrium stocchinoi TaxID=215587 RepID=A0A7S3PEH4_9STRA|mmetsp:Transcript_23225/g.28565  ORF Transcript_23225/g.28565 Transcript_23225/m.28565 type:complete len:529 (+) Transcript_23225:374-1960(+)|eukprot:CAMPEP_0204827770 /NCGR_PEP_ID=MMETSP1346-20131115/5225_1 /ASSEMBLY_ACC=CAM_ASM_000771 /TAXON_ID=215587 /ORGANISM="Aplanochytrium stocchinoi, Strain GSBS06" /LENGTH=528 /DNA_ID=CAMNT_0051956339 /DNA_START=291 /DNA_END=1877 /DNA_ORIENTATION=-